MNLRDENKLFLLCLSNGNFAGLGRVREKELEKACRFLKFNEAPTIIDDPDLQDGMDANWGTGLVADQVTKYLTAKTRLGNEHKIDTIITFDEQGMSQHPNHISVWKGVCEVMSDHQFDIELLTLITPPLWRKYISYFDISLCGYEHYHLFTYNYAVSYTALSLHSSQFVWFRKLSIIFSRNTFANSFDKWVQTKFKAKDKDVKVEEDDIKNA